MSDDEVARMTVDGGLGDYVQIAAALLAATFGEGESANPPPPQDATRLRPPPFPWARAMAFGLGVLRLSPRGFLVDDAARIGERGGRRLRPRAGRAVARGARRIDARFSRWRRKVTDSTNSDSASQSSLDRRFQSARSEDDRNLLQDINVVAASATKTLSSGLRQRDRERKELRRDARLDRALDRASSASAPARRR